MDYPVERISAGFFAILVCAALACGVRAETPAGISVEERGLPVVGGVLRDGDKVDWGFANFVAFGPGWAYTAQDYAAKEQKKDELEDPALGRGMLFTGKIRAGSRGLAFREEFFDVSKDGAAKARVRWTISSQDGKPMQLERAYLRFPLALADFAGGTLSGKPLPADYGQEWIDVGGGSAVEAVSKDGTKILRLDVSRGKVVVWDGRKNKLDRFELCIDFPDAKDATSSTVEFDLSGAFADSLGRTAGRVNLGLPPPPVTMSAGEDWVPFPWTNDVKPGSILDFSKVTPHDAPAGQFGFARVSPDGHFVFEKDAGRTPRRFVGGNLCFDANFLSKEQADRAVRDFVARGWNAIRFHHIDVTITKDQWNDIWNRRTYPEIDPAQLDRLDYLLAACKKAGVYVTFDLYAMGCLGSCEGFDKPLNCSTVKAIVPIHKPAEDQWFKRAMELFNHVNPYTGVPWKDEPSVLFVTLLNEDSIASAWSGAADVYVEKYNEWAKGRGYPQYEKKDIGKRKEFAEFLYEKKAEANRRMAKRLHDAGVRTLISGGNWWENMAQAYEREALEVVDNHQYSDHPQGDYGKPAFHINNTPDIKSGHPTYATPVMMAPARVWGKPFTVTEWNFCNPKKWRAEAGLMMGAYAALQDWDAIYRFAWSHSQGNMFKPSPAKGFDIVTDPIGQLTERQVALLFGRRDVAPAKAAAAYGVTAGEAFGDGLGDMWAKGLFPHAFTQLAYTTRVGSFVADGGKSPAVAVDKVYTAGTKNEIPAFGRAGASDTREIAIDHDRGILTVDTPRTAGVCSVGRADLSAGPLAVSGATAFCSVSASSMDGAPLAQSRRVLVLHVTDIRNTGAAFTNDRCTDMTKWGELPYLAAAGEAKIALRNANPGLKVWAVAADGTRLREVPAAYEGGAYRFTARIAAGEGADAPTMAYELGVASDTEPEPAEPFASLWLSVVDFALPLADDAGDWFARLAARPPDPADWPAVRAALDERAAALPPADRPPLLSGLRLALAALAGDAPAVAAARADFAARAVRADDTPDFLGGSARDVCDAFLAELDERLARPPPRDTPASSRPAPTARERVLADPLSATNSLWFLAGVPAPPTGLLPNGDDFSLFAAVCRASGDRDRLAGETARLLPAEAVLPGADAARAAIALDDALARSDIAAASRALAALAAFAADPATAAVRDANPSWFAPRALALRLRDWCEAVPPSGEGADAAALAAARALLRAFGLGSGARLERGREALLPMAHLLARLGREEDAVALLREAAGPDPAAWDESGDLVPLCSFLLSYARHGDVLEILETSPAWSAGELAHLAVYPQLGPVAARALAAAGRTNEAARIALDLGVRFPEADRSGGLAGLVGRADRAALMRAGAASAAAPAAPRTWGEWARARLAARALLPAAPLPPLLPLPAAAARIAAQGDGPWWESHPPYGLPEALRPFLAVPPLPLFADAEAWPATLRDLVSFAP